jgi:hypothetical protein
MSIDPMQQLAKEGMDMAMSGRRMRKPLPVR